jgi:hypothetical protein
MTPDQMQVKARMSRKIGQMVFDYQETGEYMDPDGKKWKDTSEGIVLAWEQFDKEFFGK